MTSLNKYMIDMWNNQPIVVVNDEAYDRMYKNLSSGKTLYEKTYMTACPHKKRQDCKCPFQITIMVDGEMIRIRNGKQIPVISKGEHERIMKIVWDERMKEG